MSPTKNGNTMATKHSGIFSGTGTLGTEDDWSDFNIDVDQDALDEMHPESSDSGTENAIVPPPPVTSPPSTLSPVTAAQPTNVVVASASSGTKWGYLVGLAAMVALAAYLTKKSKRLTPNRRRRGRGR